MICIIGIMTENDNDKNKVRVRKQNSGSFNRKAKQRKDVMAKSLVGSIATLFNAKRQKSLLSSQVEEASDEQLGEEGVNEEATGEDHEEPTTEGVDLGDGGINEANEESRDGGVNEENESMLDLEKDVDVNYNPGLWGKINDTKRVRLVLRGPIKILRENDGFPKESTRGRHFSSNLYICDLPNGEKQERKWLVYSNELDKVFCFCCKLFKSKSNSQWQLVWPKRVLVIGITSLESLESMKGMWSTSPMS